MLVDAFVKVIKAITLSEYVKQICSRCGGDSFAVYRNVGKEEYRVVCKRCGEVDYVPRR